MSQDQKHSSRVAKVHYQKMKSQDVALKAKTFMQKLVAIDNSNEISTPIEKTTGTNDVHFNTISENSKPRQENSPDKQSHVKKLAFSKIEDKFLVTGIRKYRYGKWTSILYT